MSEVNEKNMLVEYFGEAEIQYIENADGDIYFTAESIGRALEYSHPRKSVINLYNKHKDLVEPFKGVINLMTPGGSQDTTIFSEQGVYILTMKSNQPKADDFCKWLAQMLEKIRKKELLVIPQFDNPIDRQLFIIDNMREILLQEKEIQEKLELHDKEIYHLKQEFQEYMPLSDSQRKLIRDGVKQIQDKFGFWIWKELHTKCGFSNLETTPSYKFVCIMRIVNDYLNQTTLNGMT